MSVEAAAEELSLHVNTLGRYERGEREIPTDTLLQMANLYSCSTDDLLYPNGVSRGTSGAPEPPDPQIGPPKSTPSADPMLGGSPSASLYWAVSEMMETCARISREAAMLAAQAALRPTGGSRQAKPVRLSTVDIEQLHQMIQAGTNTAHWVFPLDVDSGEFGKPVPAPEVPGGSGFVPAAGSGKKPIARRK